MPAKPKSKIIAVSLDNTTLNFDDTEAVEPEFNQVMEDVKLDDVQPDEIKSDDVKIETPIVEKKPRAKAKPKAKPVAEPVVEPIVEPIVEAPLKTEKKQIELVECPDCKKKLSAKTYKYNHVHNCPAKRFTPQTTEPVITPTETDIIQPSEPEIQPSEPEIQPYEFEPVMKQPSVRELRAMKRKIMIDSLMSQAF